MPKMTHPNSKQSIDVAPDMAAMYESQGWAIKAPKKTARPATSTASAEDKKEQS